MGEYLRAVAAGWYARNPAIVRRPGAVGLGFSPADNRVNAVIKGPSKGQREDEEYRRKFANMTRHRAGCAASGFYLKSVNRCFWQAPLRQSLCNITSPQFDRTV